jgi:hypothetical protein
MHVREQLGSMAIPFQENYNDMRKLAVNAFQDRLRTDVSDESLQVLRQMRVDVWATRELLCRQVNNERHWLYRC